MNNNTPGGSRNRSWAGVARADRTMSAAALPAAPGTYCLWLQLETPLRIPVGRIGELSLPPGLYAYAGSALGPGGLQARAGRHLRAEKPLRWHIDWLTVRIPVAAIWYRTGRERLECAWAQAILQAPGASIRCAASARRIAPARRTCSRCRAPRSMGCGRRCHRMARSLRPINAAIYR